MKILIDDEYKEFYSHEEFIEYKKNTIACGFMSSGSSGYDFNIIKKLIENENIEINYLNSFSEKIEPETIIVCNKEYIIEYQKYLIFEIKYLDEVVKTVTIKYLYNTNNSDNGYLNTDYLKESLKQHIRELKLNEILK